MKVQGRNGSHPERIPKNLRPSIIYNQGTAPGATTFDLFVICRTREYLAHFPSDFESCRGNLYVGAYGEILEARRRKAEES